MSYVPHICCYRYFEIDGFVRHVHYMTSECHDTLVRNVRSSTFLLFVETRVRIIIKVSYVPNSLYLQVGAYAGMPHECHKLSFLRNCSFSQVVVAIGKV